MNDHTPERLAQILSRADPPPIFHRYRPPTQFALDEITSPHIYATKVEDMNDPHEFRAPLSMRLRDLKETYRQFLINKGKDSESATRESESISREQVELVFNGLDQRIQVFGLVCGTVDPRSNRMWAYYGGSHRGICIGYDPQHAPFCYARKVGYADPEGPLDFFGALRQDPMAFSDHLSCRKGTDWAFEQEYRIPVGPFASDHTRLLPISTDFIVEIRLGAKIKPDFKARVLDAVKSYPKKPRIIQMGCDHQTFRLTETLI